MSPCTTQGVHAFVFLLLGLVLLVVAGVLVSVFWEEAVTYRTRQLAEENESLRRDLHAIRTRPTVLPPPPPPPPKTPYVVRGPGGES